MPGLSSARSGPSRSNGAAMATVEFHFDFGSPDAYLAHLVIPDIERRTGTKFDYVPVLLGGVFKATGNRSPAESLAGIRNKPEYERLETERFIKRHGITRYHITLTCFEAAYIAGEFRSDFYVQGCWLNLADLAAYPVSAPQRRLAHFLISPDCQRRLF